MLNIHRIVLSVLAILVLALPVVQAAVRVVSAVDETAGGVHGEIVKCSALPSRFSIRSEYVKEIDMQVSYTEDGTTGVDGGLIHLLQAYRNCSR